MCEHTLAREKCGANMPVKDTVLYRLYRNFAVVVIVLCFVCTSNVTIYDEVKCFSYTPFSMSSVSIGSATNTNFDGGPTINATGRTDISLGTILCSNPLSYTNKNMDIQRGELLLTSSVNTQNAYVPVISKDCLEDGELTEIPETIRPYLLRDHPCVSKIDCRLTTFYSDIHDARNECEYFLAYHQISFHHIDDDTHASFVNHYKTHLDARHFRRSVFEFE